MNYLKISRSFLAFLTILILVMGVMPWGKSAQAASERGPAFESGEITISDSLDWENITFSRSYSSPPVILATPVTDNNATAVGGGGQYPVPVVRNVTTTGFDISMCVDGGAATCKTSASSEILHYFVFDVDSAANYDWIEVGTTPNVSTDGSNTTENYSTSFNDIPHVWTQAQTYSQNGEIGAVAWVNDDKSKTGFTYIGCVHTGTENSCDVDNPSETFGYVAIDVANENFPTSVNFQWGVADISDSSWTGAFFSPAYIHPRVMVTQNDDDGGEDPQYAWAKDVTGSGMNFRYCEEDAGDVCNSHSSEKTYWFAVADELMGAWHMDEEVLVDPSTWTIGSGSAPGFTKNGSDSENYRISADDPFGNNVVIWEARPDATSGADGGWNGSQFNIDNTKKYRFSVWVQRPVQGNGHFYLGTHGYGSVNGVLKRSDGANSTNPYFTVNSNWNEWGDNSSWYLAVGHVWPAGSGTGSNDSRSGIYDTSGNLIYTADLMDYVWRSETTSSNLRTYLYYSTDTSTRQRWAYPRVDVVDGSEPSIQELVDHAPSEVYDSSGHNNHGTLLGPTRVDYGKFGRALNFNGTSDYVDLGDGDIEEVFDSGSTAFTVLGWINPDTLSASASNHGTRNIILARASDSYNDNFELGISDEGNLDLYIDENNDDITKTYGGGEVTTGSWHFFAVTFNFGAVKVYLDGNSYAGSFAGASLDQAAGSPVTIGTTRHSDIFFDGLIDEVRVYNRALSFAEIENFYGIPVNLYTNDAVNPIDVVESSPTLSAEHNSTADSASFYQIQIIADGGSWDSPYWDSAKKACSVNEGDRLQVTYNGPALNLNQQKYYQRWKFWDSSGTEGSWSDGTDYFVTATPKDEYGANVRGYAWSDNLGWLSFNNSDVTSYVASYNSGTGGLEGWAWSDGVGWISLDCASDDQCNPATADHSVVVDGSGNVSGDAWSDNLGWLSFNRSETGNPPGDPYQASGAIARYDSSTKEFSGWARFLSAPEAGWDGWVKLRCYGAECDANGWSDGKGSTSGVFVDDSGYLEGWAWGSDVVGWIGFKGPGDVDYGVNIDDSTNKLSGHVWSENLGWISFDRDETGAPPSDDPCSDGSCLARLKEDNYQLDGWARALNYDDGWDGWISLNQKTGDSFAYQVSLNTDTKEFEGWAYGDDVLGWISFNHLTDGSGVDYKVYTGLPLGIQPTDPHDTWDLCADTLHPTLNWNVSGTTTGYEVEIYNDADLNNLVYRYQAVDISSTSHHADYDADDFDDTVGTCHPGGNGFQNSPTNGLVGSWHMDENSGNVVGDSSGNNNNGILNNLVTEGGFETSTYWSGVTRDTSNVYEGSYSGQIIKESSGELTKFHGDMNLPDSSVQYEYGGCVYSNGPSVDIYFFSWDEASSKYDGTYDHISTSQTGQWVCIKGVTTHVAPADDYFDIRIDNNGGTAGAGTVWFDNMWVHEVSHVTGKYGNALSFDGADDYVRADSVTNNIASSNVTVEAWIKTSSHGDASWGSTTSFNTSTGGNRLLLGVRNGEFQVYDGAWHDGGAAIVNDGLWHQVVLVLDNASAFSTYVDGVIDQSSTSTTASIASDDRFSLGQEWDTDNSSDFFNGAIDEVKIYNRVLSPTEIQAQYASDNCNLSYNGRYWWRVRVRNTDNIWGQWSSTDDFTVASSHHWPVPDFSLDPENPQVGSVTHLLDQSAAYGGSTVAGWKWLFSGTENTDYQYTNETNSTSQNPDVIFLTTTPETIGFQVTDSDGYGPCPCSGEANITSGSVKWKEVTPSP